MGFTNLTPSNQNCGRTARGHFLKNSIVLKHSASMAFRTKSSVPAFSLKTLQLKNTSRKLRFEKRPSMFFKREDLEGSRNQFTKIKLFSLLRHTRRFPRKNTSGCKDQSFYGNNCFFFVCD
jgi:hypothetical protein